MFNFTSTTLYALPYSYIFFYCQLIRLGKHLKEKILLAVSRVEVLYNSKEIATYPTFLQEDINAFIASETILVSLMKRNLERILTVIVELKEVGTITMSIILKLYRNIAIYSGKLKYRLGRKLKERSYPNFTIILDRQVRRRINHIWN